MSCPSRDQSVVRRRDERDKDHGCRPVGAEAETWQLRLIFLQYLLDFKVHFVEQIN